MDQGNDHHQQVNSMQLDNSDEDLQRGKHVGEDKEIN